MKRRSFLKKAGAGLAVGAAATTLSAPAVLAKSKFNWKMVTSWPPGMPILQEGAELYAKRVEELSGGDMKIHMFAGGELVPPLGVFDAVSNGMVQCYHSASYYWAGKHPATQWFTSVPFGMNSVGYNAWFNSGNGMKLWEELYDKFNLVPRPLGTTSYQMGGWFNKKVNSVEDLKGMKLRFPGLAGRIYAKLGASVVLLPGSEVYTSLERGVIDATDWVGPHLDKRMGLARVAKFYYYPGWQEPTGYTEVVFNKKAHSELPKDLQGVLDAAAAEVTNWMLSEFDYRNAVDLAELEKDPSTEVVPFPDEVLKAFKKISEEVLEEEANKDPLARKIADDYNAFQAKMQVWNDVTGAEYFKKL